MRGRISSATGGVLWYSRYIWINTINAFSPIKWKCQIYHCSCIRRMRTSAVQQKFGGSPCLECGDTFSVERWTVLKSTYLSFGVSVQSWVLVWNENLNPQTERHRTGACAPVKKVGRIWFIMIEKSLANFIGKLLENLIEKPLGNFIGKSLRNLVKKLLEKYRRKITAKFHRKFTGKPRRKITGNNCEEQWFQYKRNILRIGGERWTHHGKDTHDDSSATILLQRQPAKYLEQL